MTFGSFTYTGSKMFLEYMFQGLPKGSFTPWVGIGKTNGSKSAFSEFTGSGYTRIEIDSTYFNPAVNGSITNAKDIVFPISLGYAGTVYSIGFFASAVAPMPFAYAECLDNEIIKKDDQLVLKAGGYTHYFAAGTTFSNYLKDAILNDFYRSQPLLFSSPDIEFAYSVSTPSPSVIGTEPGGGYTRQLVGRNSINFYTSAFSIQELRIDVPFDFATANQGTATHMMIFIDGEYLAYAPFDSPAPVNINQNVILQSGTTFQLDP